MRQMTASLAEVFVRAQSIMVVHVQANDCPRCLNQVLTESNGKDERERKEREEKRGSEHVGRGEKGSGLI